MDAYITFSRTVRVENVEGKSIEEIKEAAVDVHNEADMDDFYATDENITDVIIEGTPAPQSLTNEVFVLIKVFQLIVDEVEIFFTQQEAEAAYETFTKVSYEKAQEDLNNVHEDYRDTVIVSAPLKDVSSLIVKTPIGELTAKHVENTDYPGILLSADGQEVAVLEYDSVTKKHQIRTYIEGKDEPDYLHVIE